MCLEKDKYLGIILLLFMSLATFSLRALKVSFRSQGFMSLFRDIWWWRMVLNLESIRFRCSKEILLLLWWQWVHSNQRRQYWTWKIILSIYTRPINERSSIHQQIHAASLFFHFFDLSCIPLHLNLLCRTTLGLDTVRVYSDLHVTKHQAHILRGHTR